ncbi:hypothetical protein RCL1_007517 [Eukaryota sp. TZLM3-RCL]
MGNKQCLPNRTQPDQESGQGEEFYDNDERFCEDEERVDAFEENFGALKPFVGAVNGSTPHKFRDITAFPNTRPDANLYLDYVFGISTQGLRNHVTMLDSDTFIYPAANLAVVYTISSNFQSYFRGHDNDVTCLALSPDKSLIATGQIGKSPRVCIWDPRSLMEVASFNNLERGIIGLAWSGCGRFVLAIGNDNFHSIAVYDAVKKTTVGIHRGDAAKTYDIASFGSQIVIAGHNFGRSLSLSPSGELSIKKVVFGAGSNRLPSLPLPAATVLPDGRCVFGTSKGQLYVGSGNTLTSSITAHTSPVLTLFSDTFGLVSAGRDGYLKFWSSKLSCVGETRLPAPARAITRLADSSSLTSGLVAVCEDGAVYIIDSLSSTPRLLLKGHGKLNTPAQKVISEAWGLCPHPQRHEVVSVGDDGQLIKYSLVDHSVKNSVIIPNAARAVAYSPDGSLVVVGFCDGTLVSYDAETLTQKNQVQLPRPRKKLSTNLSELFADVGVSDVKFSPNGQYIAVSSHTTNIFIVSPSLALISTLSAHTAHVKYLDWDKSSRHLQSMCGGYELLFWDVETGTQNKNASYFANIEWATYSPVVGYGVQGIFKPYQKGTDINTVARSNNEKYLVTGTDNGTVELFNWPVLHKHAERRLFYGHSAHLTHVSFTHDDSYIVSLGGRDCVMMMWAVE